MICLMGGYGPGKGCRGGVHVVHRIYGTYCERVGTITQLCIAFRTDTGRETTIIHLAFESGCIIFTGKCEGHIPVGWTDWVRDKLGARWSYIWTNDKVSN